MLQEDERNWSLTPPPLHLRRVGNNEECMNEYPAIQQFRIWNPEKNEFVCSGGTPMMLSGFFEQTATLHTVHKMPYQRSTSHKDKNGNEIYEGDIVHVQDNNHDPIWGTDEKHPIVFDGGAFRMDTLNIYELLGWGGYPRALTLEIIGNIYKNSKVIK